MLESALFPLLFSLTQQDKESIHVDVWQCKLESAMSVATGMRMKMGYAWSFTSALAAYFSGEMHFLSMPVSTRSGLRG
jgi:hypothetical protein